MNKLDIEVKQILSKRSFAPQTFSSMKEIFAQIENKLGVSAFEYVRVYDDGTACMLYSNHDIANYVISKQLHITAHVPEKIVDTEFWFIPYPNGPYEQAMHEISSITNSSFFVNYICRFNGFYEMYCFWSQENQSVALSKFINMKEQLEQFSLHFVDKAKNIIDSVNQDRFQLTEPMLPNFKGLTADNENNGVNLQFYLDKARKELYKLNKYIFPRLSAQEIKCIWFLFEGKTAADIADILNLSSRTVETHLNSIKAKLNCEKKSYIVSALVSLACEHSLLQDLGR